MQYIIRELAEEDFLPLFNLHKKSAFEGTHNYHSQDVLTENEHKRLKGLSEHGGTFYRLHLGVFDADNTFVGWSWGYQESSSTFYMVNSAVLDAHRRKGLYSALIGKYLDILSQKGFQLIYSRHCATNNAVIIPKLKAGFIISKMEIDDRFGVLIHLHFYTNKTRRKIMDYRSGQLKPDAEIKKLFGL